MKEVTHIFRECYFEYAGVYSGDRNLILAYVDNSNTDFDSGGKYETSVDTIPYLAESVLYNKKYSESPLEFDVEIVNPDEAIPFNQFIEIKEWLFGQDGWKKFKLADDNFNGYFLNCIFIPDSDIVDGMGYRGVKCKLKNISAFWYRDDKAVEYLKQEMYSNRNTDNDFVFTVDNDSSTDLEVYPLIRFRIETTSAATTNPFRVCIENTTNGSKVDFGIVGSAQRTAFNTTTHTLDTNLLFVYSDNEAEPPVYLTPTTTPLSDKLLYLDRGENVIKLHCEFNSSAAYLDFFRFDFHPRVRIGGF